MLGFCTSPRFVEHDTGADHPERADRIRAIFAAVRAAGLVGSPNPLGEFPLEFDVLPAGRPVLEIEPQIADPMWLATVHPPAYVESVRKRCAQGKGLLDEEDTMVCPASFEIALLSVGAALTCADAVATGQVRRAFAAVRPPGHHALAERAMGFCLFANVAIAARYLQVRHRVERIAIVDFDVHHGNGTQACFESDPNVLFVSLHQDPRTCYPGSGYEWEIGVQAGRGFTLNVPLPPGTGDVEYLQAMRQRVIPALDDFHPEMLLLSAGFDAHRNDPLADLRLTEEGFAQITDLLVESAQQNCDGKILSVLEGGYHLKALAQSVVRHMIAMQG